MQWDLDEVVWSGNVVSAKSQWQQVEACIYNIINWVSLMKHN